MILFPVSGFPLAAQFAAGARDEQGYARFGSFEDAAVLAAALQNDAAPLAILKAAVLAAAQREALAALSPAEADHFIVTSALQNPSLSFLKSCLDTTKLLREPPPVPGVIFEPQVRFPDSLDSQLKYAADSWTSVSTATKEKIYALLHFTAAARFAGGGPAAGQAPAATTGPGFEAHYSQDSAWMQNLVIVAKNVPLWLAQLSTEYGRSIKSLDEIPQTELEFLKSCGVSGIWLVGLWQRSAASAAIKKKSGNAEAASSAYSVFAYEVDNAYGGETALGIFRENMKRQGIYLGCDMVPNHTGIDSLWLREHPEWFMQTPVKPFPSYAFSGENLSQAQGNETKLEEHYYSHSDAAVVFQHKENGQTRYIYHGNDGTGLPWNDTAQLNHLLPEVRSALIDTALKLAQKFDFIRFDAAMTLLKEHYRRLWFPAPNAEPVIASRSAYAMADGEFDRQMPEFWRNLVDTFRERSPGTLLMAEAFWLTENYFIKAIGIHRVYNSAFMHFLHEEKNADFSAFMSDHLKDAATLNRFVNYLSTPDEHPAAAVFGDGDKYFGAMKLLATLPGLPLIAPGQLEGFTEKYAMDQATPRLHETKRQEFIARHRAEIAPLFTERHEFSDAGNLRWLNIEPGETGRQVIAFETGATKRFRVLFNNSPAAAAVRVEGVQFLLEPYECRVNIDAVAASPPNPAITGSGRMETNLYPSLDRFHTGVVIPLSALKSRSSSAIGEYRDLKLLVDWCAATGQNFIALLPISDTGSNPSPYSALSAFALHPIYLNLDEIRGFESVRNEAEEFRRAAHSGKTFRFDDILQFKISVLRKIYTAGAEENFHSIPGDFSAQPWLIDYAVYKTIKSRLGEAPAYAWADYPAKPDDIAALLKDNTAEARQIFFTEHREDAGFYVWLQYQCEIQLTAAANYARQKGVFLKGDLPILLERDSVDVWLNPHLFRQDLKAGAPPDNYSADGQNWGFPVYDWPAHRRDGFQWWKQRICRAGKFFSAYRIDHVLGFFRIWCLGIEDSSGYCGFFLPSSALSFAELQTILRDDQITVLAETSNRERCLIQNGDAYFPAWDFERKLEAAQLSADEKTKLRQVVENKIRGDAEMQRAQGHEILSVLKSASPMLPCAEDLGVVPDFVGPTLADLEILALCVLRWRHRGDALESTRDYRFLSVATPSVHDSGNVREWLRDEGGRYFPGENQITRVLSEIYDSASALALVPIQDLLALDDALHGPPEKERINVPGTVSDKNWSYRMPVYLEELMQRSDLNTKIRNLCESRLRRPVSGT